MAITVTKVFGPVRYGDRFSVCRKVSFDSSYPAGGEPLTYGDLGFSKAPDFVRARPQDGFSFEYDSTNKKLKVLAAVKRYTATFDAAALAGVTSRDDAVAVTGVAATDIVIAAHLPDAAAASVVVQNARVTALNTITVRLTNPSAGAVDLASGSYVFYVMKANGAAQEVADTIDLSALANVIVEAVGLL